MAKDLDLNKIKKILVINMGGIGNMVLFTPTLKALRERFLNCHICLLGSEPSGYEIIKNAGLIDEFILLDSKIKRDFFEEIKFIGMMKAKKFDLAIVASGTNAFKSSLLAYLMGIPNRIGEDTNGRGFWYTKKLNYQDRLHELEANLNILRAIGIDPKETKLELVISTEDENFASQFLIKNNLTQNLLIGMHLGPAAYFKNFRRWSENQFLELANRLINKYKASIILFGGSEEKAIVAKIADLMVVKPIIVVDGISLGQTAALIKCCNLFIASDSGPMHIAAAVGTPTVAIFGPTDPVRHHPWGNNYIIVRKNLTCSPCYYRGKVKCNRRTCFNLVRVDDVLAAADIQLAKLNLKSEKSFLKFKVLHIITRLDRGGSSENTLLSCIGLDKRRYEVWLAAGRTGDTYDALINEAKACGVKVIFLSNLVRSINPLKDILVLIQIYSLIKREKFDIVHTHSSKAGLLGRLAAKLAKTLVIIYTPHGHVFYGYFNKLLIWIFMTLEKIAAGFTDKIVALTGQEAQDWIKFGIAPADKFVIIHSGIRPVDLSEFDVVRKKEALGLPGAVKIIGSAGRFEKIKGYKYLIEAAAIVFRDFPDSTLVLIGEGPLRTSLEFQAKKLGIEKNIRFLGWRSDFLEILKVMDIFVLASLNEGMGRVLVEAQSLAKSVVATEVGGIPSVVADNETGKLVPAQNPGAMAEAILKLLKEPDLAKRLGEEARRRVFPEFSSEKMVQDIENLYGSLVKN